MNNSEINNYLNMMLNGLTDAEIMANIEIDRLYDEIENAAVYIAQIKVDNYDLELEIDDIDVDVDTQTACVRMSNDTIEIKMDYDHKTGDYEVTGLE